jgi:hypothetical protein
MLVSFVCLPALLIAQEGEDETELTPFEQCLEVAQVRYQRCTAEDEGNPNECSEEYDHYEAQSYEIHD